MTAATWLCTLRAVAVWGLSGVPGAPAAPPIVHLRVFAHATMERAALEQAMSTAGGLLESAGIDIEWQDCGAGGHTCTPAESAPQVTVLLMPVTKFTRDDVAAEVLHGLSTPVVTVLVYMPNLEDRLRTVQQSAAGRSNPGLATLRLHHLVGLAIAHEVGHGFGLSHGTSGVMKAPIVPGDLLALATSRLAFSSREAAALRRSVMTVNQRP